LNLYIIIYNFIIKTFISFSCVKYVPEPEDAELLKCALKIFLQYKCYPEALNLAIQLNDLDIIKDIFKKSGEG